MKATPASTLRNTDSMVRIKSPHMGERKAIHVLYIVFRKWLFMTSIRRIPIVRIQRGRGIWPLMHLIAEKAQKRQPFP